MANGHTPVYPLADGTLQDITQSLENTSGDMDSSYRIEDIEASLQEPMTPATGMAPPANDDEQEDELEDSGAGEDRKRLLSSSSTSRADSDTAKDLSKSSDKVAGDAEGGKDGDDHNLLDSVDEGQSLLKTDNGSSLRDEDVERRPLKAKSGSEDSVNV